MIFVGPACYNSIVNSVNIPWRVEMEQNYIDDSVRARLISAGLLELMEHGSSDFSLRRVALAAQVSCAAPYRHFKDKDELIRAIISHIREDWQLLTHEVANVFKLGTPTYVIELLVAGVRFWVAGGNFPSFLALSELSGFDEPVIVAVEELCRETERDDAEVLSFAFLSLLYGTVTLVASKRMDIDSAIAHVRKEAARIVESK